MCKGRIFGAKPVMLGLITFRAHIVQGKMPPPLVFLVDTGAEKTMVSAGDAEKLGIKYELSPEGILVPFFGGTPLKKGPMMGGIGGGIQSYEVPNVYLHLITLLDGHVELHGEHLDLLYIPEGKVREIPSLLGMDILARFNCVWSSEHSYMDFSRIAKLGSYQISIVELSTLGWQHTET